MIRKDNGATTGIVAIIVAIILVTATCVGALLILYSVEVEGRFPWESPNGQDDDDDNDGIPDDQDDDDDNDGIPDDQDDDDDNPPVLHGYLEIKIDTLYNNPEGLYGSTISINDGGCDVRFVDGDAPVLSFFGWLAELFPSGSDFRLVISVDGPWDDYTDSKDFHQGASPGEPTTITHTFCFQVEDRGEYDISAALYQSAECLDTVNMEYIVS